MNDTQIKNKQLIDKYPFLRPRDWGGNPIPDEKLNYKFTFLDDMPHGWKIAFGEQMCEELKSALEEDGVLESYSVLQVKEKFGFLHWYDCGTDKTNAIIRKYEDISERTCIRCGKPATKMSLGWISPFCEECATELSKNNYLKFRDINSEEAEDNE